MKKWSAVIVVLCITIFLTGCAGLVKTPHVTVQSTDLVGIDTAGFDIELVLAVENPNIFDVSLLGYTYDLELMAMPFSSGGLQKGVLFPAGQKTDVRLPFRIHHSDLLGLLKRKPDLDKLPYRIDARLNLASPLGEIVIPIKKNDTFAVPAAYRPGTYLKRLFQPFKEALQP